MEEKYMDRISGVVVGAAVMLIIGSVWFPRPTKVDIAMNMPTPIAAPTPNVVADDYYFNSNINSASEPTPAPTSPSDHSCPNESELLTYWNMSIIPVPMMLDEEASSDTNCVYDALHDEGFYYVSIPNIYQPNKEN